MAPRPGRVTVARMTDAEFDDFLEGRLSLRQGGGHRAGHDAVLLAALTPPETEGLILDVGAGAGAVGSDFVGWLAR